MGIIIDTIVNHYGLLGTKVHKGLDMHKEYIRIDKINYMNNRISNVYDIIRNKNLIKSQILLS